VERLFDGALSGTALTAVVIRQ
ncbi:hypothetical protein ACV34O_32865, partial [Pseudomonas aeruginosa]